MDLAQRPPYDTVDFKALTKKDPDFKQIWQQSSGRLDFQDPATVKALSKAILNADFGLHLDVPDDRLCPPIPNRWNYVAWMQSLIDSTSPSYSYGYDCNRKVTGLDIGTGSSAIYTLLCLQSRLNWTMCATDIDKKSFESAARNLALNNLMTRTKLLQTTELNPLIPLQGLGVDRLDFTLCNPPFFTDITDMSASLKGEGKSWRPNSVCTGAEVEMVCPDGDLGFVTRIVNESLVLKEKVQWYSSMLGKLSSAKSIIDLLKKHGITNWAVGIVDTGASTKRWIVAWSFGDLRPRNVSRNHLNYSHLLQALTTTEHRSSRNHCERIPPLSHILHHPAPILHYPHRCQRHHQHPPLLARPHMDLDRRLVQRHRRSKPKRLETRLPPRVRAEAKRRRN
jgi:23S rRNA (adenine1618-N6)-methyltransferase